MKAVSFVCVVAFVLVCSLLVFLFWFGFGFLFCFVLILGFFCCCCCCLVGLVWIFRDRLSLCSLGCTGLALLTRLAWNLQRSAWQDRSSVLITFGLVWFGFCCCCCLFCFVLFVVVVVVVVVVVFVNLIQARVI